MNRIGNANNITMALRWIAIAVVAVVVLLISNSLIAMANSVSRAHLANMITTDPPKSGAAVSAVLPSQISLNLPATAYTCRLVRTGTYQCSVPHASKKR
jgi:hypothetical protein